ncbi:CsgG/HfaB family protein [Sphingomonas morindae]|uniref:CsgG/HfaB family protein n=1 Tax=Sphingomonas morindae TaxID=1541170 RepID=A0ABY4XDK0_9SPHN|nr:CsgG/HfaB family protein [Sphingomonas morindae]USI74982.1 CsgG/HfaB family protein [Sphingomonas morindae]
MRAVAAGAACLAVAALSGTAAAQKMGKGGTAIGAGMELPVCAAPVGTVALVEAKRQDNASGQLSPGLAALLNAARAQQGQSEATTDPLPLLKLILARSQCFRVVDRGEGFDALQRERALAAGGQTSQAAQGATIEAADYLLTAQIVYQDENAGSRGLALGGLGGAFGGLAALRQKKLESQTMLTLVAVKTGVQEAVATGSARKRDLSIIGGGLAGLGLGLLGGEASTDIGKVTSAALLDAYRRLVPQIPAVREGRVAVTTQVPEAER